MYVLSISYITLKNVAQWEVYFTDVKLKFQNYINTRGPMPEMCARDLALPAAAEPLATYM